MEIHASTLSGQAICGKPGKISMSGTPSSVTCEDCLYFLNNQPTKKDAMLQIKEAAKKFRENKLQDLAKGSLQKGLNS